VVSERAGILGPAGAVPRNAVTAATGAGPQQVGGGLGHESARAIDDLPSVRSNFDGAPTIIGEVEIDAAGILRDADVELAWPGFVGSASTVF
jgi:hypothetical protein